MKRQSDNKRVDVGPGQFAWHTETKGISTNRYATFHPAPFNPEFHEDPEGYGYIQRTAALVAKNQRWQSFIRLELDTELRRCKSILEILCWNEDGRLPFRKAMQLRRAVSHREYWAIRTDATVFVDLNTFERVTYGRDNDEALLIEQSALAAAWSYYCEHALSPVWLAGTAIYALLAKKDEFAFGYLVSELNQKLRNEPDALRGKQRLADASAGGKKRSRENELSRRARIEKMKALILRGHSVKRAAELAHMSGLGVTPGANVQMWKRHKKK